MNEYILVTQDSISLESVPNNIRAELRRKGVTMHELARLLEVGIGYVQRRLSGSYDLSLADVQKIADLLEVHVLVLLFNPLNAVAETRNSASNLAVSA